VRRFANRVAIEGEAGQPRPVLWMNATGALQLHHAEATLRWVEIDNAGGGAALYSGARLVDQVVAHSSGAAGTGCMAAAGTIRNSICRATGTAGAGAGFTAGGACGDAEPSPDATLRGVTAWATGAGSYGVAVRSTCAAQKRLIVANTIAQGGERDVLTKTDANANTRARVESERSNFNSRTTDGANATVAEAGTQSEAPVLVDPSAGDFHQRASSPTVGAGTEHPDVGSADFEGTARPLDTVDIGADEFQPEPRVMTGAGTSPEPDSGTITGLVTPMGAGTTYRFEWGATAAYGQTTPVQEAGGGLEPVDVSASLTGLTPNTTYHYRLVATNPGGTTVGENRYFTTLPTPAPPAPALSGLAVGPRTFAIGSRLPTLLPARKRPPTGTTISFTLSHPATAKLVFFRIESGRRVGGKCRTRSRSNAKRPRCTRKVAVRTALSVPARAGLNRVRFQGRIGSRQRLGYGQHELVAVATDANGRSSAPRRTGFKIVKR
jgi:hypothetical protein